MISLVNEILKLNMYCQQKYNHFLPKNIEELLQFLTFFSAKNKSILDCDFNKSLTKDFVRRRISLFSHKTTYKYNLQ